jgi:hypothetical protein
VSQHVGVVSRTAESAVRANADCGFGNHLAAGELCEEGRNTWLVRLRQQCGRHDRKDTGPTRLQSLARQNRRNIATGLDCEKDVAEASGGAHACEPFAPLFRPQSAQLGGQDYVRGGRRLYGRLTSAALTISRDYRSGPLGMKKPQRRGDSGLLRVLWGTCDGRGKRHHLRGFISILSIQHNPLNNELFVMSQRRRDCWY